MEFMKRGTGINTVKIEMTREALRVIKLEKFLIILIKTKEKCPYIATHYRTRKLLPD